MPVNDLPDCSSDGTKEEMKKGASKCREQVIGQRPVSAVGLPTALPFIVHSNSKQLHHSTLKPNFIYINDHFMYSLNSKNCIFIFVVILQFKQINLISYSS